MAKRKQNPNWVHIPDGQEDKLVGRVAKFINDEIRKLAIAEGTHVKGDGKPLCPGCLATVIHNATVELTVDNGHPMAAMAEIMVEGFEETKAKALMLEGGLPKKLKGLMSLLGGDEPDKSPSVYRASDGTPLY